MVIYKATNHINGKCYVGQTKQPLKKRVSHHVHNCGAPALHHAIKKYGLANFSFEVIDCAETQAELDAKERHWIGALGCMVPNGYNITSGGGGASGYIASASVRAKISLANKGKRRSDHSKELLRRARLGIKASEETRRKMSDARKGRTSSAETRSKLSEAKLKWNATHASPNLGRKHSDATLTKMRNIQQARAGRGISDKELARLKSLNVGRKRSAESRRKQSETSTRHHLPADDLAARYLSGETTVSLAAAYGCSDDIINKNLRAAGVEIRNQSAVNILRYNLHLPIDEIARSFVAGESINRIAAHFYVSRQTVNALLCAHGIQTRSIAEANAVLLRPNVNNKSGFRGVSKAGDRWAANFRRKYLGCFRTPEEASAAYESARNA